jgi:hypothetical protein
MFVYNPLQKEKDQHWYYSLHFWKDKIEINVTLSDLQKIKGSHVSCWKHSIWKLWFWICVTYSFLDLFEL